VNRPVPNGDCVAEYHACKSERGPVHIREARRRLAIAVIPADVGSEREQWRVATFISRALCYEMARVRAHRRMRGMAFVAGMLTGIALLLATQVLALGLLRG
jgi:hypothetical protein